MSIPKTIVVSEKSEHFEMEVLESVLRFTPDKKKSIEISYKHGFDTISRITFPEELLMEFKGALEKLCAKMEP